jgi:hypothetical protein
MRNNAKIEVLCACLPSCTYTNQDKYSSYALLIAKHTVKLHSLFYHPSTALRKGHGNPMPLPHCHHFFTLSHNEQVE